MTPIKTQKKVFKLKNGVLSLGEQSRMQERKGCGERRGEERKVGEGREKGKT